MLGHLAGTAVTESRRLVLFLRNLTWLAALALVVLGGTARSGSAAVYLTFSGGTGNANISTSFVNVTTYTAPGAISVDGLKFDLFRIGGSSGTGTLEFEVRNGATVVATGSIPRTTANAQDTVYTVTFGTPFTTTTGTTYTIYMRTTIDVNPDVGVKYTSPATLEGANFNPTADAGPNQTVASEAGVTLDGTGSSDPESQPLTYAWTQTGGPAVTLSGASAAQPTFTAPAVAWNASPVVLTFELVVFDGVNYSTADTVNITVDPAENLDPTADAGPDQTVASEAGVTLDGTGSSDPENQTLTYAWTQTGGPAVTLSDDTAAQPTFTAPAVAFNAPAVVLTFQLVVFDGVNYSTADTVDITVDPAENLDPTADAGPDQTVASEAAVTLDGTGSSDPESQPLTYAWTQTGGPAVTLSDASAAQPSFTAPAVAIGDPSVTLTFELVVFDGVNYSTADTVDITVDPAENLDPTADAGPDQTVGYNVPSVTLDGTGSSDPENQTLSYAWTQTGGTSVILTDDTAAQPSFDPPLMVFGDPPIILTFSLVVNDGVNDSTADTVQITINPPADTAPTADAGADQTVASAAGVILDGTGSSDPELQPLTYAWTQTGGPSVILSDDTAAQPSFTAPAVAFGDPAVVLTFQLVVFDGVNYSTADTVQVTVNPSTVDPGPSDVEPEFQEVTQAFMNRRAERILSSEPLAYRFNVRREAGGLPSFRFQAEGGSAGGLNYSISSKSADSQFYVWSEGEISRYDDASGDLAERDGEFAIFYLGADYLLTEKVALGFIAQVDRATETVAGYSHVTGRGWLIGPYLTAELGNGLDASIRAAWGRSDNSATVDGFAGDFETERSLFVATLQGSMDRGQTKISPLLELGYFREVQADYTVSDGVNTVDVEGLETELGRLSLAVNVEWLMPSGGVAPVFFLRPKADWNFLSSGFDSPIEDFAGSLELGFKTDSDADWMGEISLRYDGIGAREFEGWSLRAYIDRKF